MQSIPLIISRQGTRNPQYRHDEKWDLDKINDKLRTHMVDAVNDIYNYSKQNAVSLTEAAYTLAIQQLL